MSRIQSREEERGLSSLRREVNRLRGWPEWPGGAKRSGPPVDLMERPASLIVEAEIPGIDPGDIDISVTGDVLTLHCRRRAKREPKDTTHHMVERRYGAFARTVALPTPVDAESATALVRNGILRITLPKRHEAQPHRIEVKCA